MLSIPEDLSRPGNQLRLAVTYWRDISEAPGVSFAGTASLVGSVTTLVELGPVGGGWYQESSTWLIGAGDHVEITLHGDADWGSIIDTVSVAIPEPTTGILVAGAALLLARRPRRRA